MIVYKCDMCLKEWDLGDLHLFVIASGGGIGRSDFHLCRECLNFIAQDAAGKEIPFAVMIGEGLQLFKKSLEAKDV